MSLALHRQALQVLEQALEQPDATRLAWLEMTCSNDEALMGAVTRMLAADAFASDILPTEPPEPVQYAEMEPPQRIGPYRLDARLGRGGMGEVFLGIRDDGVFNQTVAIKLLRPSLFPTASEQFFDSERRVLASLKHPGIARILDGGVEEGGRPYFVMELVEGQAIDTYVVAQHCTQAQIGDLISRLCRAVQHAHQALVVHADIKPSNVLVEAGGIPRLLDFGIAVLVNDEAEIDRAFPVTPAFASPQRLTGARPSTADDVFSLGALLRDLTPPDGLAPDLVAIIAKATHSNSAERYSTAAELADDLDRWASHRPVTARSQTSPYLFSRWLRRRRWLAAGLAAAAVSLIGATSVITGLYLQAREARATAEARFQDSRHMARYLIFDVYDRLDRTPQSLAIRNDVARVGQSYLINLSQDRRASVDLRLEAVEGLIRLATLQSSPTRGLGRVPEARQNLARAANLTAELTQMAPGRADIALAGARIHMAQANIVLYVENDPARTQAILNQAQAEIERARVLAANDRAVLQAQIQLRIGFSLLRQAQGDYAAAVAQARQALAQWSALPANERNNREMRLRAARAYDALAEGLYYSGDPAAAEAPYRQQLALLTMMLRQHPSDPELIQSVARAHWALGGTLLQVGRNREGLAVLEPGLRYAQLLQAFDRSDVAARRLVRSIQVMIGQGLTALGRHNEAITLLRATVQERRDVFRATGEAQAARDYAVGLTSLGDALLAANRRAEACGSFRETQALFTEMNRHGALATMDRDYAVRLLNQSMARAC